MNKKDLRDIFMIGAGVIAVLAIMIIIKSIRYDMCIREGLSQTYCFWR